MRIKYAGPKVIISHDGIDFDNNKEDLYVYLNIAIRLLSELDKKPITENIYHYDTTCARLNDNDIMSYITKNLRESETIIAKAQKDAEDFVNYESEQVRAHEGLLSKDECEAWLKNINLMKTYVTQRHFNKSIYFKVIEHLINVLKDHFIAELHTPMYQKFVYIFQTIQNKFQNEEKKLDSEMLMYEESGKLMIKLSIQNNQI